MVDKISILLLYCLFINLSFSQQETLIFEYEYTFNPTYDKGFVSKQKSKLVVGENSYEIRRKMPVIQNSSMPQPPKLFDKDILMGRLDDNICYRYYNKLNTYDEPVVVDSLPVLHWELLPEIKEIKGYSCRKAKTTFRGSEVYAYYTEEIPLYLGPYKFRGLPGLILELFSTDMDHHWRILSTSKSESENVYEYFEFENLISLKQFIQENEQIDKKRRNMMNARLKSIVEKNGGTFLGSDSSYFRSGIEKIYEWELKESAEN